MCVIAYKPLNVAFPEEKILRNCFENNSDGAGFMYAFNGNVHIQKGYETFEKFLDALNKARAITGDKVPYVMHFRIATQGYMRSMTHPFPLTSNMKKMYRLKYDCNIGVAHNGILDITSDGSTAYSDTMLFITDYLSNIIQKYSWYKNDRIKTLIENLIDGSRLAILDKNGHCELMGKGWEESNKVYYSNSSYAREPYKWPTASAGKWNSDWWDDWDNYYGRVKAKVDYKKTEAKQPIGFSTSSASSAKAKSKKTITLDPYYKNYNDATGRYEFKGFDCPGIQDNDSSYCGLCSKYGNCAYTQALADEA